MFERYKKNRTIIDCSKSLEVGEFIILKSDEVPNKKIEKNNNFCNKLIWMFRQITSMIKYPPNKGGIILVVSCWCKFLTSLFIKFLEKIKNRPDKNVKAK